MSTEFDKVATCMETVGNWDVWEQMSDKAKGIALAYHRETRAMETWTAQEQERKSVLRSLNKGRRK